MQIKMTVFMLLLLHSHIFWGQIIFNGGHSHNDYHREHPLYDALNAGMVSIEADVFLKGGKLLVGHEKQELEANKSLDKMYLQPLFKKYLEVDKNLSPIILLIDIKSEGELCYTQLKKLIQPYKAMLTSYDIGDFKKGMVTLILSGDRPIKMMRAEKKRFAFVDGRLSDMDNNEDPLLMPLLSDDWFTYFKWNGVGEISKEEYNTLQQLVTKCHHQNKMIRFWGTPTEQSKQNNFWKLFNDVGIDLLGSDAPELFKEFETEMERVNN